MNTILGLVYMYYVKHLLIPFDFLVLCLQNRGSCCVLWILLDFIMIMHVFIANSIALTTFITSFEPLETFWSCSAYHVSVKRTPNVAIYRRDADGQWGNFLQNSNDYIAAEFSKDNLPDNFTVGDNKTYGGYYNAPLAPGHQYSISLCTVSRTTKVWTDWVFLILVYLIFCKIQYVLCFFLKMLNKAKKVERVPERVSAFI